MTRLTLLLFTLVMLFGCSKSTEVSARFINGRLAFVPLRGEIGCIQNVSVVEVASGRTVWDIPYGAYDCVGGVPLVYGDLPGRAATVPPQQLRTGVLYEISGLASGGNYFGGRFAIRRIGGYRVEDVTGF